jgi:tetratricopeptide (TPR) repeat protein
MTSSNHIFLGIFFAFSFCWAAYAKSISDPYRRFKPDTAHIQLLNDSSFRMLESDLDVAEKLANMALELSKEAHFRLGKAHANNTLGLISLQRGNFVRSEKYFRQAHFLFLELRHTRGMIMAINNIGVLYEKMGNYPSALEHYRMALEKANIWKSPLDISKAESNIGNIHFLYREYPLALEAYKHCLATDLALGDSNLIATSFFNLGMVNRYLLRADSAAFYYQKAIAIAKRNNYQRLQGTINLNQGVLYQFLGELGEAKPLFINALRIAKFEQDASLAANAQIGLAQIANAEGRWKEGVTLLANLRQNQPNTLGLREQEQINSTLSESYEGLGEWEMALEYHKFAMRYRDSVFNEQKARDINTILLKSQQSENELLRNERKLQEIELKSKALHLEKYKWLALGLFAIITALSILSWRSNKINSEKEKINQLLLEQQAEVKWQTEQLGLLNDEIMELNEQLEERVQEKTQELLHKNERLRHYLYLNSHRTRSPLSNILGITQLLELNAFKQEDFPFLIGSLRKASIEMDQTLHEINQALSKEDQIEAVQHHDQEWLSKT